MPSKIIQNKTAIVLGVNGQDGSYLSERLVNNGWRVVGLGRQESCVPELGELDFTYRQLNIADTKALDELVQEERPDAIFHTAAIHGSHGFNYEAVWEQAHLVNTVSLHCLLQAVLRTGIAASVFYFGSAKMFGNLEGRILHEGSTPNNQCIYSITKNASASLIKYYRKKHGIKASTIWLFNHESVRRRSDGYFVSRIVDALHRAKMDQTGKTTLQSLDFWCDIGHASEYMQILADNIEILSGRDVVMATGKTVLARDMVNAAFARHNLNATDYLDVKNIQLVTEETKWHADISLLRTLANCTPQLHAEDVIEDIYRTRVQQLQFDQRLVR